MCAYIFAASLERPIDRENFVIARDTMYHRGPDACGARFFDRNRVALVHRRLSIIDLTEAHNQPMQLDNLWVVYNGEIYNFPALRKELGELGCHFKSHSDTEVLLHGYKLWGDKLCNHLEGMFAFAIYDQTSGKVFLGRDHGGQKPLHYAILDGVFVAASEIKAIQSFFGQRFALRQESFPDYLGYDYVPDPYTWYRDIRSLMPGHFLEVRMLWRFAPALSPGYRPSYSTKMISSVGGSGTVGIL